MRARIEPDPLGCMRELLIKALTRLACDPQTCRLHDILRYKCEYTGELVGLRERMQALSLECDQRIAKALSNAVNKGQLPSDLDCQRAAVCLHAYMEGIEANWLRCPTSTWSSRPRRWSIPCWTCCAAQRCV